MNHTQTILLILDIDETLLHATVQPLEHSPDCRIGPYVVYLRPYLAEFLEQTSQLFKLALWSSSSPDYVEAIVSQIIPASVSLEFAWSRDRCITRFDPEWQSYYYVKDLRKVKRCGYDLNHTLIVDDTSRKVERNYGNAIYVTPWFGDDRQDNELRRLAAYLPKLCEVPNLRRIEKRNWKNSGQF